MLMNPSATALLASLLMAAASSSISAQNTALAEDFSGSQFPPPGWSEVHLGPNSNGWQRDGFGQRAWHEDFSGSLTENRLISPAFSLVGYSQAFLHFDGTTNYASYLANHPSSIGDGISSMQVSTDGGLSWTTVWTDTALNSFDSYAPSVDLNSYRGLPNVLLGVYFYGTFAQEWWVDNIIIDDTPVPILTTLNNPANGHPYYLLGASDHGTAQAMALSLGGSLVSIEDVAENAWVRSQLATYNGGNRELWLGLSDAAVEGQWAWDSHEAMTYQNWAPGEPNNGGGSNEDFAILGIDSRWRDVGSNYSAFGVVEISGSRLDYSPLVAGQLVTFGISGLRQDSSVVFLFSNSGAGPMPSPFGPIAVDPSPLRTPAFPSQSGSFHFSTYLPLGMAGSTLYSQAVELFPAGGGELSDALALAIQ